MSYSSDKELSYANANDAFVGTLRALRDGGNLLAGGKPSSNPHSKAAQASRELLGHQLRVNDMRSRIVSNSLTKLNIPVAVARFVWMMGASNRLADIAFYEPKVKAYTDDGVTVPGSCYGMRILQAHAGINQLDSVIARLKDDPTSRRAAISIYQPTDATRTSNDIPCAFGLFYHIRDGRLQATTIMRSNNAQTLLPFNLFEFSLLAELVAAEVGVGLGALHHFAASMHYFEDWAARILPGLDSVQLNPAPSMDAMPSSPSPLAQVRTLIGLEAEFRHASSAIDAITIDEWIQKVQGCLHPYWQQLAFCLLLAVVARRNDGRAHDKVRAALGPTLAIHISPLEATVAAGESPADLFEGLLKPTDAEMTNVRRPQLEAKLLRFAKLEETKRGAALGAAVVLRLRDRIYERAAARGSGAVLTEAEFEDALKWAEGGNRKT